MKWRKQFAGSLGNNRISKNVQESRDLNSTFYPLSSSLNYLLNLLVPHLLPPYPIFLYHLYTLPLSYSTVLPFFTPEPQRPTIIQPFFLHLLNTLSNHSSNFPTVFPCPNIIFHSHSPTQFLASHSSPTFYIAPTPLTSNLLPTARKSLANKSSPNWASIH